MMGRRRSNHRVEVGAVVAPRELIAISGERVRIPDPNALVHLQFRRFAGCPFCTLHLASVARRHDEIAAAGIKEIVLFHATAEALRKHQGQELPFAVIPDPHKRLYREFGVESSLWSVLDPRALPAQVRGLLAKGRNLGLNMRGGPFGLPADLLIAPDSNVLAVKYGDHAYDQWSVDELLSLAERRKTPP
jgi:peroxiredoxin